MRGEGWGEGQAPQSSQAFPPFKRLLAGGRPAAGPFLLLAQKKEAKEEGTPLRWPSAPRSRQGQAGKCGNSLCHNFEGSEARTSELLLTALKLLSAADQSGWKTISTLTRLILPRRLTPAGEPPNLQHLADASTRARIISPMSPTIFREGGFRFYFFSREETEKCMCTFRGRVVRPSFGLSQLELDSAYRPIFLREIQARPFASSRSMKMTSATLGANISAR